MTLTVKAAQTVAWLEGGGRDFTAEEIAAANRYLDTGYCQISPLNGRSRWTHNCEFHSAGDCPWFAVAVLVDEPGRALFTGDPYPPADAIVGPMKPRRTSRKRTSP